MLLLDWLVVSGHYEVICHSQILYLLRYCRWWKEILFVNFVKDESKAYRGRLVSFICTCIVLWHRRFHLIRFQHNLHRTTSLTILLYLLYFIPCSDLWSNGAMNPKLVMINMDIQQENWIGLQPILKACCAKISTWLQLAINACIPNVTVWPSITTICVANCGVIVEIFIFTILFRILKVTPFRVELQIE